MGSANLKVVIIKIQITISFISTDNSLTVSYGFKVPINI